MNTRRTATDAFTLVEMLVVISIITIIMAIATAFVAFSQSNYRLQATANNLISSLRRARSEAMSNSSPVNLVIRKKKKQEGHVLYYPEKPVAAWEFDSDIETREGSTMKFVPGAFGQFLTCRNSVSFVPGPVGAAVEFRNAPSGRSAEAKWRGNCAHELNLMHPAAEGFAIRFSYWTGELSNEVGFLIQENGVRIGLDRRGRFVATFGQLTAAGEQPSATHTWADVRISFLKGKDGKKDRLIVHRNGRQIAFQEGYANPGNRTAARSPSRTGPNRIRLGLFPGGNTTVRMDRLRYNRIVLEEMASIPQQLTLGGDRHITFQPDGTSSPSEIVLSRKGIDRTIRVKVLPTGTIQQISEDSSPQQNRTTQAGGKTRTQ